ncbi:MAG: maleylacetoacetate isomerase [Gammaproteobacteria bacterium RIFCSPHIGHO2_12_FULL_41_20]|nr:MAG: maleylacetoacetate isomerase [Gammaproteobacteria bacterium RIFCSPHIGHO2_12_FULL_41_20]
MLILYDYFRSSAAFRVRIALNIKQLTYQAIPIHLVNNNGEQFSENYSKINPQNLVPALQDHQRIITQSIAIIEYLDEQYPTPPLLPHDSCTKALIRAFSLAIAADIHPLNNLRVLNYLKNTFSITEEQKNIWYQHWIKQGFTALEKQLISYNMSGNFCFGDTPTLADICLVPQMYNARRFACDLSHYPTLINIDKHCQQHPDFKNAFPVENKI